MYCNECGQTLPDGSRFCNKCGATIGVKNSSSDYSSRGPVEVADYVDEHVIFTLRPTLIFVLVRSIVAALIVIATAALMGILHSSFQNVSGWVPFLVILGVAIIAFANPIYHHILRKREVYTLTNHKLEMRYGIIAKVV